MAATVPTHVDEKTGPTTMDERPFAGEVSDPVSAEVPDPALDRMIARFAGVARSSR